MGKIASFLLPWVFKSKELKQLEWNPLWGEFLQGNVSFYEALDASNRDVFHQRILLFWRTTKIESGYFEVSDEDRLLVAASAIIPVWNFPKWHYFNLTGVYLLPATFNQKFECGKSDSIISGMVGTGPMSGKMALSKPHLHLGFKNNRDKQNVGIHEFVHLIDMADGECDGFPERLKEHAFAVHWFELVEAKITEIDANKSNIRDYGATNRAEFFAVASEYFFERPRMMQQKHPQLYQSLADFYQQSAESLSIEIKPFKNAPCPCNSGKKYKRCCQPAD